MLRMVITPNESTYPLPIPEDYIGKKLEILLYTNEVFENKRKNKKKPSDFFGTLSANDGKEFHDYVTNSRLEWNRNI